MTPFPFDRAEWQARVWDTVEVLAGELDWKLIAVHSITAEGHCTCHKGAACDSAGKHPAMGKGWEQHATSDLDALAKYFRDLRNIGIPEGLNRIGLVDVDGERGMATYHRVMGKRPPVWTPLLIRSGRLVSGYHLYFDDERQDIPYTNVDKLEIRVGSHQHLAPPSRHVDGREYSVMRGDFAKDGRDLPPLPQLLAEWAHAGGRFRDGISLHGVDMEGLFREPVERVATPLGEGDGRRTYLFRWACKLRGQGLDEAAILAELRTINREDCDPPKPDDLCVELAEDIAKRYTPNDDGGLRAWGEPLPLAGDLECNESFPLDALPEWWADYCRALAEAYQMSADAFAVLSLGVFATAIHGRVQVRVQPEWVEETGLWVAVVMESGEGKSQAWKETFAPIRTADRELRAVATPKLHEAEVSLQVAKERAEKAKRALSGRKGDAAYNAEQEYRDAVEALRMAEDQVAQCAPRILWVDDTTPERFVELLGECGWLASASPEGGHFDSLTGRRYSDVPNLDGMLKSWSGEPIRVHRKGRPDIYVERAVSSIIATIQPEVVRDLVSIPGTVERGLVARFLFAAPPSQIGFRNVVNAPAVPRHLRDEYNARVSILLHEMNDVGLAEVSLADDAWEVFVDFRTEREVAMRPGGRLYNMRAWAAKLDGKVARIAAVLHFADHGADGRDLPISAEVVAQAVAIGRYFAEQEHARVSAASPDVVAAGRVLDWILAGQRNSFTTRDVHAALRGTHGLHEVRGVRRALDVLADHDYIRKAPTPKGEAGRPKESWNVNPAAHAQNPQNPGVVDSVDFVDTVTGEVAA